MRNIICYFLKHHTLYIYTDVSEGFDKYTRLGLKVHALPYFYLFVNEFKNIFK